MRSRLNLASSLFCKRLSTLEDSKLQPGQAKACTNAAGESFLFLFCMKGSDASILYSAKTRFIPKGKNLIP